MVYAFYPPYSESGNSRVAYEISKKLASKGHDITVYTTNVMSEEKLFAPIKEIYSIQGVDVHYCKNILYKPHSYFPLFYSRDIIRKIRENLMKYDIVHLHEYRFYTNIVVRHYARKFGIPYVLQAHGSLPRVIGRKSLKSIHDTFFGHRLLRDASKVIALTSMEAEQYKKMGMPDEKIVIIPNGIDLSEYADLPPKGSFKKKFGIDSDEKIVLYVGRIHKSKGLDLLAHAFKIVSRDLSNVRLVLVGPDDGYAATFTRLISDLGIEEKVLLTGFVDERSKLAALAESDVFVTPRFYGFPVTFLEACLAGCPIVTISDGLDWIHENVGYVVENSPIVLAKAISNILQDEQVHIRFRNNCRHIIKNFDISTIASRLENTYKSVVR